MKRTLLHSNQVPAYQRMKPPCGCSPGAGASPSHLSGMKPIAVGGFEASPSPPRGMKHNSLELVQKVKSRSSHLRGIETKIYPLLSTPGSPSHLRELKLLLKLATGAVYRLQPLVRELNPKYFFLIRESPVRFQPPIRELKLQAWIINGCLLSLLMRTEAGKKQPYQ